MIRIGILGAGQLALMLAGAANAMGVEVFVFAERADMPASRVTRKLVIGHYTKAALRGFIEQVDLVIFESEFVDTALLREAARGLPVSFLPELSSMEVFQDKLSQKRFCVEHGLPTARFEVFESGEPAQWFLKVFEALNGQLVLKWSRQGYDGKGNMFVRGAMPTQDEVTAFVNGALAVGGTVYAEELIPFDAELAIVCCRNPQGKMAHYPVVYSEQRDGICLNVRGPAVKLGLANESAQRIREIADVVGGKGNLIGAFAVELFQRGEEVFVNEIAPRVHNTGHYTQDASITSQFANHIRVALGWELGSTESRPFFAMRNILGPAGVTAEYADPPVPSETSCLHWYGKSGARPGRKLGHINTVAETEAALSARVLDMLQDEEVWISRLGDLT